MGATTSLKKLKFLQFKKYKNSKIVKAQARSKPEMLKPETTRAQNVKTQDRPKSKKLMPCPFTGLKMFCVGSNFLSQPKNLTAFSAFSKIFVPAQKTILLNGNHLFVWHKMFVTATICK